MKKACQKHKMHTSAERGKAAITAKGVTAKGVTARSNVAGQVRSVWLKIYLSTIQIGTVFANGVCFGIPEGRH